MLGSHHLPHGINWILYITFARVCAVLFQSCPEGAHKPNFPQRMWAMIGLYFIEERIYDCQSI